jgi:hypothetical protein
MRGEDVACGSPGPKLGFAGEKRLARGNVMG